MVQSIRPESVVLFASHFTANRSYFDYDSVVSIRYRYARLAPLVVDESYQVECDIYIRNVLEPIRIRMPLSSLNWPVLHTAERAGVVTSKYEQLCTATYQHRLARYLDDLRVSGFFVYDMRRFMRDGRIMDQQGGLLLHLPKDVARVFRRDGYLEFKPSVGRLRSSWGSLFGSRRNVILTEHDSDVFYALLDSLFGVSWSSSK